MILENGVVRTMDPSLPTRAGARDRRSARRGRRRHARDGAAEPGRGRSRRALRAPRLHRLARALPDVVALAARGEARGRRRLADALERVRAHPRHGSWIRGYGWRSAEWDEQPTAAALDAVTGDVPGAPLLEGLPLRVAQLRGARAGERRSRGRGRRRRAGREPASRPASCARSRRGSSVRVSRCRARTSSSRRRARGCGSPRAAASSRSTTRTAGSARPGSSSASARATG